MAKEQNNQTNETRTRGASELVNRVRYNNVRLVTIGIMSALAVALVYMVHMPIIPSLPFLEYDPADIPIFIITILFGWPWGLAMTVIVSVLQGITVSASSGWIGIIMHIFATGSFVLASGLTDKIFGRLRNTKRADGGVGLDQNMASVAVSFIDGLICMLTAMLLWNYIFTPIFMGMPREAVVELLPLIMLFNFIKGGANALVAYAVFASGKLARFIKVKRGK